MQGSKVFTVMDLNNGGIHVLVERYTAFIAKQGLLEFNNAPFGVCNSPAVFARYVKYIFNQLIKDGVMELYVESVI